MRPYLTKVDSRHDSTNHARMFLDEPSGKAERVLAAPGIRIETRRLCGRESATLWEKPTDSVGESR